MVQDPPQSKFHSDDDPDVAEDICGVYMDLCQQEAAKHSKLPPLWIGNNDIRGDEFEGERLKNVPHGMNGTKSTMSAAFFRH